MNVKWTDEKIEQLKELWERGKNDEEIAEIIGMPTSTIRNKRYNIHLKYSDGAHTKKAWAIRGPWSKDDVNRLKQLAEIYSTEEIAEFLGRTVGSVAIKAYKLRIPIKGHKSSKDEIVCNGYFREFSRTTDMLVMQYLSEGYSWAQIAMVLHRDLDLMKRYYTQHKDRLLRAHEVMMHYDGIYAYKMQNRKEAIV